MDSNLLTISNDVTGDVGKPTIPTLSVMYHTWTIGAQIGGISDHTAYISFWIPRRQAISTDTSFEIKMMVKIYAIEIIFKSHEPFPNYLLIGQA